MGGISEVAKVLGVTRQQVANLRARPDFPAPAASLSVGDVWDLSLVRRWRDSGLRRGAGRPTADSQAVAVGRRFKLGNLLGGGGFAEVYRAEDLAATGSTAVAVKILRQAHALDPVTVARFERELLLMSQLSHPNVMSVLASGRDDRVGLWYAMPLASGSLDDQLRVPMDQDHILEVMREICAGLAYIHDKGILHRDLKPANVLRAPWGAWAIADLGLARAAETASARLTATEDAMGSPFYTAPEQWLESKRVDERADIFSLGKILQALVSGETPVDDNVPAGILRPVILRAISSDPGRRYQGAAPFLKATQAAIAPAPHGRWETPEERGLRLRQQLNTFLDMDAVNEVADWAYKVDPGDYTEMGEFAETVSILPDQVVRTWWEADPQGFTRMFNAFAERLTGGFDFSACDPLADFVQRTILATSDAGILREGMTALARLGEHHNRWHVRDVAMTLLQAIRENEDAVAAVEGFRVAGRRATEWTVGRAVLSTLHPILRAGLGELLASDGQAHPSAQGLPEWKVD